MLLPMLLSISIATIVATIVSSYYTIQFNGSFDFSQADFVQMAIFILLAVFALLPYGVLAILLSVIGRSLILPMIGGLVWILIELVGW